MKRNKGIGLIQVIVAMGLVGMLALFVSQITSNATKTQIGMTESFEYNEFVNKISMFLTNETSCKESFLPVTNLANNININQIKPFSTALAPINVGDKHGRIRLASMKIVDLVTDPVSLPEGESGKAVFKLEAEFEKSGSGYGSSTKKHQFELITYVKKESGNIKLERCYTQAEGMAQAIEERMCESYGGLYYEDTGCELDAMPKNCRLFLRNQDRASTGGPVKSVENLLNKAGFVGLRLQGDVNYDDTFELNGRCLSDTGHRLSQAFKSCRIAFGFRDVAHHLNPSTYPGNTPARSAENTILTSYSGANRFQTTGDVNRDDRFYYRLNCSAIPSSYQKEKDYLEKNCKLCFGTSNVNLPVPEVYSCAEIGNSWKMQNIPHGTGDDVDDDNLFFIGFFCGKFPGLHVKNITW